MVKLVTMFYHCSKCKSPSQAMDWVLSNSWHSPVCISTTLLFLLGGGTGTPVTTMGTGGSSLTASTEGAEGAVGEGEGEVLCLISAVLLVALGQPYLVKV